MRFTDWKMVFNENNEKVSEKISSVETNLPDIIIDLEFFGLNLNINHHNNIAPDINNAISYISKKGGGIINIPYRSTPFNMEASNGGAVKLNSNVIIKFNGNTIVTPSNKNEIKSLFYGSNLKNVEIYDLGIVSVNDSARVITNGGGARSGLGSNISGFHLHGKNIKLHNIYLECLEFGIQFKKSWSEAVGDCENLEVTKLNTYKTKQPLYMTDVYNGKFTDFNLDLTDSDDSHDHHVYMNGNTRNLFFQNIKLKNGKCWSINIKSDLTNIPKNSNIQVNGLTIEDSWGVHLDYCEFININGYHKTSLSDSIASIRFGRCSEIMISNIHINGGGGFFDVANFSSPENIYISIATVKNTLTNNVINLNANVSNLNVNYMTIIDYATDKNAINPRVIFGNHGYSRNATFKNCKFIFPRNLRTQPISFRGDDTIIIDSCEFINDSAIFNAVNYNLSPATVVTKNNYFKGFNNFKANLDTGTVEYDNIKLN